MAAGKSEKQGDIRILRIDLRIMRTKGTLDALFPTVRSAVLSATLLQPDHWWFMTELARHLEVTPSSLQRELASLVASGFLLRRQDGRRVYFKANTESPVFPELRGLVEKTVGLFQSSKLQLKNLADESNLPCNMD
jgi:DNA-binding IclR family transcriptional regulator